MTEKIYIPFTWEVKQYLSDAEYLVFALCHGLDERGKKIYFSNEYMGKLLNKSGRRIQQIISSLEKKGFIKRIINGTKRIINIMYDKINALLGRNEFHPKTKDVSCKTTKKISPNNIVINNKEDESKFSLDFFENYFKKVIGKNKKNINIELLSKKFFNKYFFNGGTINHRQNWEGIAQNYLLSWESNIMDTDTENNAQKPYKRLLDISKIAKTININGGEVKKVVNGYFKASDGKAYKVYNMLKLWYEEKKIDILIDGKDVKM